MPEVDQIDRHTHRIGDAMRMKIVANPPCVDGCHAVAVRVDDIALGFILFSQMPRLGMNLEKRFWLRGWKRIGVFDGDDAQGLFPLREYSIPQRHRMRHSRSPILGSDPIGCHPAALISGHSWQ